MLLAAHAALAADYTVMVATYNFAGINNGTLETAKEVASRTLAKTGAELRWVACPVDGGGAGVCSKGSEPLIILHLLPAGSTRLGVPSSALGKAFLELDVAAVFHDRVLRMSRSGSEADLLGHVIAHEIGHLLLGKPGHSKGGLMKARWDTQELKVIGQKGVEFTDSETSQIARNLKRWLTPAQGGMLAANNKGRGVPPRD
jgi:hypothetical protein